MDFNEQYAGKKRVNRTSWKRKKKEGKKKKERYDQISISCNRIDIPLRVNLTKLKFIYLREFSVNERLLLRSSQRNYIHFPRVSTLPILR